MLKCLAILALLLTFAPIVSGQPDKAGNSKQQVGKSANPNLVGVKAVDKQANSDTGQTKPDPDPPKWYTSLERPDWLLVAAAFLTLGIVCLQTIETRRAAQGAQRSADASLAQIVTGKQFSRADIQIRPSPIKFLVIAGPIGQIVQVKFFNIGNSTAKDIKIVAGCKISKEKEITVTSAWSEVSVGMLRERESSVVYIPFDRLAEEGIGPNQVPWYVCLWGVLTYSDIYGDATYVRFRFANLLSIKNTLKPTDEEADIGSVSLATAPLYRQWQGVEWNTHTSPSDQETAKPN